MGRNIPVEDLKGMAYEHLSYEIEMFQYPFSRLGQSGINQAEKNTLIETALVHARCLMDFLYPQNPSSDDVIADDYFDDPIEFRKKIPPILPISSYLKRRTGKEIMHLTYRRNKISPAEKVWNFTEIHNQIFEVLATFFESLPEDRSSWFRVKVSRSSPS